MLAPRKKLWSTPLEVIEQALQVFALKSDDTVYDIGAGTILFMYTYITPNNHTTV